MSSQDDVQDNRGPMLVLIAAVLLAVGVAVGVGINKSRGTAEDQSAVSTVAANASTDPLPATESPAAEAMAPAADASVAAAPVAGDDASVVIENGVVKFYFASGNSDLASGAMLALGDAIAAAKAGKRLVLSGFHDASGDPAKNAELAKQRAMSVRDALVGAGVVESAVEVKKPEEAVGSGNAAEARRVEVMIVE
jgi:outer membrane protein OmpA-like peptidoglycan-associated protein